MPSVITGRRVAAGLLLAVVGYRLGVLVTELHYQASNSDVHRFFRIATQPGIPYREVSIEYPPLTVGLLKLIAVAAPTRAPFGVIVMLVALVAEAAVVALLWRGWGASPALAFALLDSLLIDLLVVRLDLIATALAVAAAFFWRRRRPVLAGALVAMAAGVKLWPVVIGLFLVLAFSAGQRRRFAVAAGVAGGALLAVWVGLGGVSGIAQVVGLRGARGWQIESAMGTTIRLFTGEAAATESGADRFGHVPAGLGPGLALLGLAVAVWAAWRGGRDRDIARAWIAGVGAIMLTSTLLSPQFVVWLLPAGAIAWVEGGRRLTMLLGAAAALTLVSTHTYSGLVSAHPAAVAVVMARNACLVAVVAAAAVRLGGRQPSTDRASVR